MNDNESYNNLVITVTKWVSGGGAALLGRGAWGWWKSRREGAVNARREAVEADADVRVEKIRAETAEQARLWVRIGELEDSQREMFVLMRQNTESADKRVREADVTLVNKEQELLAAKWFIEQQTKDMESLSVKIDSRDEQIDLLKVEISRLSARLAKLDGGA